MKNRLGWSLASLAILSFTFGQSSAAAAQIFPTPGSPLVVTATTSPPPTSTTAPPPVTTTTTTPAVTTPAVTATVAKTPAVTQKVTPALKAPAKASTRAALAITPATDPTKIPHYFGPFPNWAWSPQVLANALVTLSNGGGTGAAATATVDPKTGGVTGYTITNPWSGYTTPPDVLVTSPGLLTASGAAGTAVIGTGVLTSIAVAEPGFGFTTPSVVITGGGAPSAVATAQASGGVDNLTISSGGTGYAVQPLVSFSLPDAPYCSVVPAPVPACAAPTAAATMTGGAVDTVTVVTPGSGYLTAPTVTIKDGPSVNPTAATVVATISIGRIDILNVGAGYDSVPVVTISDVADPAGPIDRGATATATLAAKGAVTGITVVTPGTGYLTPGLKKFVDTLSGLGPTNVNTLGNYIPIAVPDTTTYPGTDYYEIAAVQYRQKFASSMPATLQRGYVQLSTTVVPGAHVQLTNENLDPAIAAAIIPGRFGVDKPYSLGPTIVANKDRPVRVLFRNLLPTGVAGNLFLPVDTSIMGSGEGPNGMMLDPVTKVPMDMVTDTGLVTDGVRNPACGQIPKPTSCYTENRATLHLHGGVTPWISDGTPHQWTTPAGETTPYPEGVSVSNVPDMVDPGPGAETFFYTNQQSARLMFYHDHAWGITRLNVYAGEAAGYLVTDATEKKLTGTGGALQGLGVGAPLIVQDKTFVSSDIANTDPTWDATKWGGEGSLWLPHVYMPAQNPGSPSGSSVFGRWMYGPWFWPPAKDAKYPPIANPYYDSTCVASPTQFCEPPQIPSTPNNSVGMEAFGDTPIVNGTAYPTTTVDPKAYRYRILNAGNDRSWNLQWYVADPTTGTQSEVALDPAAVAAAQTDPNIVPTPDLTKSPVGPSWIQIGNEGGFLPTPTVVPNQPITWITDPTRFDFGNVDKHSLLVAPAERADVIVDFSQYRGKTLIMYNDAPAAFPARQASYDMYTGGPDFSPAGPHPTLPGYGPNTRTMMQVKVSMAAPAVAFDRPNTTADRLGALMTAFAHHADGSGVFESGSDPVIVGQSAYNTAYGTTFATNGWCGSPTLPSARCDGFARIQEQGGMNFKFDTLGPNKDGNGPQLSIPLQPKGIHDEANSANFDEWGRMSANMGLEAPGATPLLQNIILYPFVNPATEVLDATSPNLPDALNVTPISSAADGTQIWKITHNGVDTHPLHWHLYNVQVINRVTWDNIIIPPDANELGWKETVRVSPLEDTYVAVRPIVPTLPFGVPDSKRLLNPMMPEGAKGSVAGPNGIEAGFNNTDANGNPIAPIANTMTNFGWEYVWHCHMLSHEEMDMMRPVTVATVRALPTAPVLSSTGGVLNWTDGTPVNYAVPTSWSNPGTAEIGYRIDRATVTNGVAGAFATVASPLANQTNYTDTTAVPGGSYMYRAVAYNAAGASISNVLSVVPQTLSGVVTAGGAPVPNAILSIYNLAGVGVGAYADASGAYSISLPPATYKIYVTSTVAGYPSQWVGGSNFTTATPTVFSTTATQNIALVAAPVTGVLSGVVTAGGSPVPNAILSIYTLAGVGVGAYADASGAYSIALPPDSFKVYVTSTVAGYPSQWVGGSSFTTATTTVFSASATLNIALVASPVAGVLSGMVTAGGAPVPNAILSIYNLAGVGVGAYANASGAYSIALPPATYKIHVTSTLAGFPSQWVGGANFTAATSTVFSASATLNIVLHP